MNATATNSSTINFAYVSSKFGDLLIYIKNIILTGSFNASSGTADYAGSLSHIMSWVVTILIFSFFIFVAWVVYIRLRIYEVDQKLDTSYKAHYIKPEPKGVKTNARWEAISAHFASSNPNDWRAAIIDADSMMEELITSLGYTGASFGEKLKSININEFPALQSVWEAHKVRNLVAHEGVNYNLTERQKEITKRYFENVFRSAGLL